MDRVSPAVLGMGLLLIVGACAPTAAPPTPRNPPAPVPAPSETIATPPATQATPAASGVDQQSPAGPLQPVAIQTPPPAPDEPTTQTSSPAPATFPATNPAAPVRAYLGIVPDPSARASTVGILIQGIQPGSPAAASDVQAGDVIITFDDHPVPNLDQLDRELVRARAGQTVRLEILRGVYRLELNVRLGAPPAPNQ